MALSSSWELLSRARAQNAGVGAFNVTQLEHAEAFAAAAREAQTGVIMQISQNAAKYHRGIGPLLAATLAAATECEAPTVVHLDHAEDRELVTQAITRGANSVMFDGSRLPYAENVKQTAEVVREAHAAGVWVEAELGEVGGKDGVHAPGVRTDPGEAAEFVAATGVDALAVAVGSSHAMTTRSAALDFGRISELRATLDVPLVLHGSSGVSDADMVRAVAAGMTKINISTHLNSTQTDAIRHFLNENPTAVDARKYLGAGRAAVEAEVARLLSLLAGT